MKFNTKEFKSNMLYLFLSLLGIVIVLVLSTLFGETNSNLEIGELDSGSENISKLVINEIMSSNGGVLADENGKLYDWIELYNGNNHDINLKNYGLSDEKNRTKWVFPDVTIKSKDYLIVYLSGTQSDGLYAPFKLKSSGGETLALKKPNNKIVDAVETVSLKKNQVMGRSIDGNWKIYNYATPGFSNTIEGYDTYKGKLVEVENKTGIVINEFLPRNKGNFITEDGTFSGYIEIKNTANHAVNIEGFSISNELTSPYKYQFDDIVLNKDEVLLIYTDNSSNVENLYSGFKLYEKVGCVVLTNNKGEIIEKVEYENLGNGTAYIRENNKFFIGNSISPGFDNNEDGRVKFAKKYLSNKPELIINEVMNSNYKYLAQNGNRYYDWVELYNNSNKTVNLKDYYLTTSTNDIDMYNLPDVKLESKKYYIIMASGNTNLSNNSYKHANFKLSEVQSLYLVKKATVVDSVLMANIPVGYSMGRNKNYGYVYMKVPTPKKANTSGTVAVSYTPTVSQEAGIYKEKINVSINANGTIYYTTNGSNPTKSAKKYTGPFSISKTQVVKIISYENNKLPSKVVTMSYVINSPHTMPVMSISLKGSDFSRVQSNAWKTNIEVPAYAELFEDGKSFSIPCGFELFGGSTRGFSKKSFQIQFKKKYGASTLEYQVFENRDFSVFDTLVLRSGSQDYDAAFIRDMLVTGIMDKYGTIDVQAYKTVALYINGKYWGLYNIREKVDETFVENHYNVDASKANIYRIDYEVKAGSRKKYTSLIKYVNSNNMAKSANYKYIKTQIDIENLIDFWIGEIYVTNYDILNVRMFNHPDLDDNKMKFIFYDFDYAMYNYNHNYFNFATRAGGMGVNNFNTSILRNLMKNSEFRKTFVERLSWNMKNVWTKKHMNDEINRLEKELKSEMTRDHKRWNISMTSWNKSISELEKYVKLRQSRLLSQAKSYFKLSNSEYKKYFGDV